MTEHKTRGDRSRIEEAKQKLPLPELLRELGHTPPSGNDGGNMQSPFAKGRRQKTPSFSIFRRGAAWGWCDRSGGKEIKGDEISLLEALEGLSKADAIRRYLSIAGVENARTGNPTRKPQASEAGIDWPAAVEKFGDAHAARLCEWRGYSRHFVDWLKASGLIGVVGDGIAFPVRSETGEMLSVHVRPKSGRWFYLPKGRGVHPLVIGDLAGSEKAMVFESQWDALAVMDAARWHEGAAEGWAVIVTRGASNGRFAGRFAGAVYAWPQNDEEKGGKRAGEEWLADVVKASAGRVYRVSTPEKFADANDWTRAGAVNVWAAIAGAPLMPKAVAAGNSSGNNASKPDSKPEFSAQSVIEGLELYWLNGSSSYFLKPSDDVRGRFLAMGPAEIRRKLRVRGVRQKADPEQGEVISPLDLVLDAATEKRAVDYAINLGGTPAGVYDMPGGRILVKESPRIIEPVDGKCDTIQDFLVGLLGAANAERFLCWLKVAYEALRRGEKRPGQALVIVGPSDCGKSRIQHHIITPMLGGRSADPKSYFFGRTDFNSEMIGAEHLLIEEIPSSTGYEDRVFFGERIKEATVNDTARLHGKMRDAVMVHPFWRLSITLNNEPDKLRALPPMTPDVSEKMIIIEAKACPDFWTRFESEKDPRAAFRGAFDRELPALANLLSTMTIPDRLAGKRYGVASFIPDELAAALAENEPEFILLMLIDKELWRDLPKEPWHGDADDLKHVLTGEGSTVRASSIKLCARLDFLGTLLSKLARAVPSRVKKLPRTAFERGWEILPAK